MTDNRQMVQPTDANRQPINRAMGKVIPCYDKQLSSASFFADLFELDSSVLKDRVFMGMHVNNPSGTVGILVAITNLNGEDVWFYVKPQTNLAFDNLTFGSGIQDETLGFNCTRVRAKLTGSVGANSSGSFDASLLANPADGAYLEINGKLYEFHDDDTITAGRTAVEIKATKDLSWTELANIINQTDPLVHASYSTTTDILTISYRYGGTAGDAITIADGSTGAAVSGATLTGGSTGLTPVVHIW